jgi:hypothetical protein
MSYQSINSYDGKTLKTFERLTDKQFEAAHQTAAARFETWQTGSFAERAIVVAKAAKIMGARLDEFAHSVTLEMGKFTAEARGEETSALSDQQSGDPVRAARAIFTAVESPRPPRHLLLGNDAYEGATAKLEELRKEFAAWEAVSRGADFPRETQGLAA